MTWNKAHIKSTANTVGGILIGFVILYLWGISFRDGAALQLCFIIATYIRTYLIEITVERLL